MMSQSMNSYGYITVSSLNVRSNACNSKFSISWFNAICDSYVTLSSSKTLQFCNFTYTNVSQQICRLLDYTFIFKEAATAKVFL